METITIKIITMVTTITEEIKADIPSLNLSTQQSQMIWTAMRTTEFKIIIKNILLEIEMNIIVLIKIIIAMEIEITITNKIDSK